MAAATGAFASPQRFSFSLDEDEDEPLAQGGPTALASSLASSSPAVPPKPVAAAASLPARTMQPAPAPEPPPNQDFGAFLDNLGSQLDALEGNGDAGAGTKIVSADDFKATELHDWLLANGLDRYAAAMAEVGYTSMRFIRAASPDDVEMLISDVQMVPQHANYLRAAWSRLVAKDAAEEPVAQYALSTAKPSEKSSQPQPQPQPRLDVEVQLEPGPELQPEPELRRESEPEPDPGPKLQMPLEPMYLILNIQTLCRLFL